jgi:hypothetical protein
MAANRPLSGTPRSRLVGAVLSYAAMVLAAAALFLLFRSWGEGLTPTGPPVTAGAGVGVASSDVLWHVLLALVTTLATTPAVRLLGLINEPAKVPRGAARPTPLTRPTRLI